MFMLRGRFCLLRREYFFVSEQKADFFSQPSTLLDRLREALMIYTHVLNRGPSGVRSPVDEL